MPKNRQTTYFNRSHVDEFDAVAVDVVRLLRFVHIQFAIQMSKKMIVRRNVLIQFEPFAMLIVQNAVI